MIHGPAERKSTTDCGGATASPRLPPCRHEVDSIVVINQASKRLAIPATVAFGNDTFLTLHVSRGQTKFPHRPVTVPRFVIGSGSGCDIVLGDAHVPLIHTILLVDGGRVIAETVARSPLLKVNGNVVGTAILEDGDALAIGGFQFVVRLNHEAIARTLESTAHDHIALDELEDEPIVDAADLSAAELVDCLEAEMNQVEQLERQIQTGQAGLLQAAIDRNTRRDRPLDISRGSNPARGMIHGGHGLRGPRSRRHFEPDDRFVDEFERVRTELEDFSMDLDQRLQQVHRREDNIDAAAKELAEAQNKLVAQLGTLLEQIAMQQTEEEPRAIA